MQQTVFQTLKRRAAKAVVNKNRLCRMAEAYIFHTIFRRCIKPPGQAGCPAQVTFRRCHIACGWGVTGLAGELDTLGPIQIA